jgi:hypothetical protein
MTEAAGSSETLVSMYQTFRNHIPEYQNVRIRKWLQFCKEEADWENIWLCTCNGRMKECSTVMSGIRKGYVWLSRRREEVYDCAGATSHRSRDFDVLGKFTISSVANFKGGKASGRICLSDYHLQRTSLCALEHMHIHWVISETKIVVRTQIQK